MKINLDDWQKEILETKGNIVLRSGRQVGKSTVISIKAGDYALANPGKTIMVIASVERQAFLLFEKILAYIYDKDKKSIKKGKDRPTKSKLKLTNGSTIYCLPTGLSGHGIRGYTVDLLIADEAAFIAEEVWDAVTPMLAVTGGNMILLSTPFGRDGFFYKCFQNKRFTNFHVRTPDLLELETRSPEQREWLRGHVEEAKEIKTKLGFAQEYLGEFVDELRQFFPEDLIKSCMTLKKNEEIPKGKHYLGVDVARMGRDDSVLFSISERNGRITELDVTVTSKTLTTETVRTILAHDNLYNYKKIYIDDQGLGVAVFDPLLEHNQTRRKVVPINNSSRGLDIDKESGKKTKLLKEDLYNNLLSLMERGKVRLHSNPDVMLSLKSIQYEYTKEGRIKIFGKYSHIAEALIRAAWCIREKSLNIYIY